jgi:plasmid maintenance system antidote protein VapI
VKSDLIANKLNFDELIERLRAYIRHRIHSGEYTERSLARILRVSQPHLHNMLKGVRRVNVEFADQVMTKFRISILDLMDAEEMWNYLDEKSVNSRKPAGQATERERIPRARWRTGS